MQQATAGTGAAWIEQAGGLDRESLVIDPPDGRIPPLQPEAIQRLIDREKAREGRGEGDSWLDRNTWERCISRTLPVAMVPNIYNANYQILQTARPRRDRHGDDPRDTRHSAGWACARG